MEKKKERRLAMANSITTNEARAHLARAHAGAVPLCPITKMAFGDGGVDEAGNPIPPDGMAKGLRNELLRKDIESYVFPTETSVTFICTLLASDLNDQHISEVALIDSAGNVVAIKTFKATYKDAERELAFEWTERF
jgi:phage-related tail fiber protein